MCIIGSSSHKKEQLTKKKKKNEARNIDIYRRKMKLINKKIRQFTIILVILYFYTIWMCTTLYKHIYFVSLSILSIFKSYHPLPLAQMLICWIGHAIDQKRNKRIQEKFKKITVNLTQLKKSKWNIYNSLLCILCFNFPMSFKNCR